MICNVDDNESLMGPLHGLLSGFEHLIVTISALGKNNKLFTFDSVKSRLLQGEQCFKMRKRKSGRNMEVLPPSLECLRQVIVGQVCVPHVVAERENIRAQPMLWWTYSLSTLGPDVHGRRPPRLVCFCQNCSCDVRPNAFVGEEAKNAQYCNLTILPADGNSCHLTKTINQTTRPGHLRGLRNLGPPPISHLIESFSPPTPLIWIWSGNGSLRKGQRLRTCVCGDFYYGP